MEHLVLTGLFVAVLQRIHASELDALAGFSLISGLSANKDPKTNRLAWFVVSAGD